MNDLTPGSGRRMTRSQREGRAYRLVLATGAGAVATVVLLVLSVAGAVSFGLVLLVGLLTAVCGWLLRRTMGR
ncbi:MAG: hypothetical protein QOE65_3080 [Solirubrobacteraceae bacterium]|jgi:hypothetical protein|nr:hypothetical protein [Solirubrobacteraceae bacterium]